MEHKKQKGKRESVDLAALYPRAKSYETLMAERLHRNKKRENKLPKQTVVLTSALGLSLTYLYTIWMVTSIPRMLAENPYVGARIVVIIGLVWMALVYFVCRGVFDSLYKKGWNPIPLFLVYSAFVTPMVILGIKYDTIYYFTYAGTLTAIHFFVTCLLFFIAYTSRLRIIVKVAILSAIWTSAFIAVLIL